MTHTSTEQPEALRKLARYNDDHLTREEMDVLRDAALEIGLLRDRIVELEASQAQRAPLSDAQAWEVINATHNLEHFDPYEHNALFELVRATEAAHGITQEKQG